MCLLNGDLGGNLPHSTDFGVEEYYDKVTGDITYNKILLKDIFKEFKKISKQKNYKSFFNFRINI